MNIPTVDQISSKWHEFTRSVGITAAILLFLVGMALIWLVGWIHKGWIECAKIIDEALER